jgi:hypothetical protein
MLTTRKKGAKAATVGTNQSGWQWSTSGGNTTPTRRRSRSPDGSPAALPPGPLCRRDPPTRPSSTRSWPTPRRRAPPWPRSPPLRRTPGKPRCTLPRRPAARRSCASSSRSTTSRQPPSAHALTSTPSMSPPSRATPVSSPSAPLLLVLQGHTALYPWTAAEVFAQARERAEDGDACDEQCIAHARLSARCSG